MSFSSRHAAQRSTTPENGLRTDAVDGGTVRRLNRSRSDLDLIKLTRDILEKDAIKDLLPNRDQLDQSGKTQKPLNTPETLDLSSHKAKRLPLEVIDLVRDRVERLALSHNDKISIPVELSLCTRLFYLNLRWNNFTAFPEALLGLTQLQTLDLSHNRITAVPESIKSMASLKYFAFANNWVTRLPFAFGDMASLMKIRVEGNPVEYPPPESYRLPVREGHSRATDSEAAVQICTLIKKYLRQAAQDRQRMMDSESEMSESNLETPRPARRTAIGRFPVRPSLNGTDTESLGSAKGDGTFGDAPPIPQRHNARDSLIIPHLRRPGLTPINTQGLTNRTRSETVASGSLRAKRLGYVPSRKMTGPSSASVISNDGDNGRSQHFRTASYSSSHVAALNSDLSSSGPVSPQAAPSARPWLARSRLSSLPEDRRVSHVVSPAVRSARLIVYSFDQLNRPIDDAVRMIKSTGTPGVQMNIERLHYNATHNLKELDRELHLLSPMREAAGRERHSHLRVILTRSRHCFNTYSQVVAELRQNARKMVMCGDPMYVRALMMQLFAALLELKNACTLQEAALMLAVPALSRISQATTTSDRSATPTLTRSAPKRLRGIATNIRTQERFPSSSTPLSAALQPLSSSRTNALGNVLIPPTPSTTDSSSNSTVIFSQQQNTQSTDNEDDGHFERIYLNLRQVCDLADQTLANCRMDFFVRKEEAARSLQGGATRAWTLALNKCDSLLHALDLLKKRLKTVRVNDPANRTSKDFWHVCDTFVRSWYDLASEMKSLGHQGIDIGGIKVALRPLQKAVKDMSHVLNHSPVYKGSLKPQSATPLSRQMPPTPLSAALGPAAQATVPSTPSTSYHLDQEFGATGTVQPKERERERADTMMSRYATRR